MHGGFITTLYGIYPVLISNQNTQMETGEVLTRGSALREKEELQNEKKSKISDISNRHFSVRIK
jgi:hypothetical protein